MMRPVWITFGIIALALGLIGIPLPLLPTAPFLLLAAFFFARSSRRLHDWLLHHPKLGPPIIDWQQRGAIGKKTKWWSTVSVLASFGLALALGVATPVVLVQGITLAGVALFIWTRPDR